MNTNPFEIYTSNDKLIEANNLNGMGAVHEKRLEFDQAQRYYEEALSLYEEVFGQYHLTTALVSRNLARVMQAQGNAAEAAVLEDMAEDILKRREDDPAIHKTPFGGSSAFFCLMGLERMEEPAGDEPGDPLSNRLTVANVCL